MGALCRKDGQLIYNAAEKVAKNANAIREDWAGLSVLHTAASQPAAYDIGFVPGPDAKEAPAGKWLCIRLTD